MKGNRHRFDLETRPGLLLLMLIADPPIPLPEAIGRWVTSADSRGSSFARARVRVLRSIPDFDLFSPLSV